MRDLPDVTGTQGKIRDGRSDVWGYIRNAPDADTFKATLARGKDYRIQMRGRATYLHLQEPLVLLASSDGQTLPLANDQVTMLLGDSNCEI